MFTSQCSTGRIGGAYRVDCCVDVHVTMHHMEDQLGLSGGLLCRCSRPNAALGGSVGLIGWIAV